jgi:hypothetical protein
VVVKPEGKKHLEDLGLDGRVVLKWFLKMGWINLAYNKDKWGLSLNVVMIVCREFLIS